MDLLQVELSAIEKKLINRWQKGFPLTPHPFALVADELGLGEQDVLDMLTSLQRRGVLSRVGAVVRPNSVAASSLVAMAVPAERLAEVAAIVGAHREVNHNYEREDKLNLWFVVTAPDACELDALLARIEQESGLETHKLPLQRAYHIDLGFGI